MNPYKPRYIPVDGDANGLVPELLRQALQKRWKPEDAIKAVSDMPKV